MKALMSKGESTVPLQAKRHPCSSWLKEKPQHKNRSTEQPCCQRIGHCGRRKSPGVHTSTQSHQKIITYSNEGCSRGLITDVEMPSISFLNHSFKWAGTRKEDILPPTQWASFITLAVLHYSPIIFYFDGIIREVLIWLFHNSENEYPCNIKLLL